MEFVFESSPLEMYISKLQSGQTVSASYLLTLLEGEEEALVEQAFESLRDKGITFELADLPRPNITGESGLRLRREAELAKQEKFWLQLEETDPLRLYLEELQDTADDLADSEIRVELGVLRYRNFDVEICRRSRDRAARNNVLIC